MEQYIIMWLYIWGGIVTGALATYANLIESGERHKWASMLGAMFWPIVVPTVGVRWFIRRHLNAS